jgi:dipeptidyl-peptidase-4
MVKRLVLSLAAVAVAGYLLATSAPEAPLDADFLRQYAVTRGFMLGRPVEPRPTPDGTAVLFLRSEARSPSQSLYEFNVATLQTRELLTPAKLLGGADENLSPEEKARRERQRVTAGGFTDYQLSEDGRSVLVSLSGRLYVLERAGGRVEELQTGPGPLIDPQFSPDGGRVAYVRDYDVYVYDLAAKRETRVTTGGTREKTHGLAEFVAQEEMSRHSGYWWSPDGRHIAYEEADAAGVEVWYVADPMKPDEPPQPQFYPRPGKKNVAVRLGVVPATGGATVWVEWDRAKYEYLAAVRWDKDSPLTILVQDRKQQELLFLKADPTTGKTTEVVRLHDNCWVNLIPDLPRCVNQGGTVLWTDDQDGLPNLWQREITAKGEGVRMLPLILSIPERQIVNGAFVFHSLVDFDGGRRELTIAGADSVASEQSVIYRVRLGASGAVEGATETVFAGDGLQSAVCSTDHSAIVVTRTSTFRLPLTYVLRRNILRSDELPSVAETPSFRPAADILSVQHGNQTYKAAVVRPGNFDPAKKYPVIVDVYGGPKHQHVLAAMRSFLLRQWLADQGFVVVAIDGRGTPNRDHDWERAVYLKFGNVPLDDQVAGLQALGKKFPELDLTRVGIVGWSFGGYLSALAVLKRPDVFHAAVAGAPVCDWLDYDTHYTERYLGLPQENPEAYKDASLLTYADRLSRPLLIVHGTADDNVFFRHSLKLTDGLFRAGKEFEVLPLPGLTHMVPDPVVTERLWTRVARHFQKHLGTVR